MDGERKFFIAALGCPKNIVEAELISGAFLAGGDSLCFDPDDADIYIVNTCAFLPEARAEAAAEIATAVEWKAAAPGRKIAVAGCLMNHAQFPEFKAYFREVDLWCKINDTAKIRDLLDGKVKASRARKCTYLCDENMPRMQLTLPHVAYLKICDGCDNRCAYCAIPIITGKHTSRPMEEIIDEVKLLVSQGVKEFQIIAQELTYYGVDLYKSQKLPELIERIAQVPGVEWIRLHYAYPTHFPEDLFRVMRENDNVCKYMDIAL